ncbi:MAG: hypothetical protein RL292_310 [Candidatus Parcubacteria bacterium]|jgi:hypothetical protein
MESTWGTVYCYGCFLDYFEIGCIMYVDAL